MQEPGRDSFCFSNRFREFVGDDVGAQASTTVTLRMDPTYEAVVASGGLGTALTDALLVQSDAANAPELEVPVTGQVNLAPQAVAVEMVSRNDWVKSIWGVKWKSTAQTPGSRKVTRSLFLGR